MTPTLAELHALLSRFMVGPAVHDMLDLSVATFISGPVSQALSMPPCWVLFKGPPATGKTEILDLYRGHARALHLDELTDKIDSHKREPGEKPPETFIDKAHNSCVIFKDMGAFLQGQKFQVRSVLKSLVQAYDGNYDRLSGTVGLKSNTSFFSVLGGTTSQAWRTNQDFMNLIGPRFLIYRVPEPSEEEEEAGMDMSDSADPVAMSSVKEALRAGLQSLASDLLSKAGLLTPESYRDTYAVRKQLKAYARMVKISRTVFSPAPFVGDGGRMLWECSDPQQEGIHRAHKVMRVLLRCLCLAKGVASPGAAEMELMRKLAIGSMPDSKLRVLWMLRDREDIDSNAVIKCLHCSRTWAHALLDQLVLTGLLRPLDMSCYRLNDRYRHVLLGGNWNDPSASLQPAANIGSGLPRADQE